MTVLHELDAGRKRSLLAFLHEARLIVVGKPAASLPVST